MPDRRARRTPVVPGTLSGRALVFVALLACAACGAGAAESGARGVLIIHADVPQASLWIDDRLIGDLKDMPGGVRLRAGAHRVELRHDRYHTRYLEITLHENERRVVEVSMAEALP